jgi:hypothetical protein
MLLASESNMTIRDQATVKRTSGYHSSSKRQNHQPEKFNFKGAAKL